MTQKLSIALQGVYHGWKQQGEQISQVGGKLIPQVSFDQIRNG